MSASLTSDTEYAAELAAAMSEIGAHWVPTSARFHGAPDLTMVPTGIYSDRQIFSVPGITHPHTPETCREVDTAGMWVLDDLVLVCTGCGLDCT